MLFYKGLIYLVYYWGSKNVSEYFQKRENIYCITLKWKFSTYFLYAVLKVFLGKSFELSWLFFVCLFSLFPFLVMSCFLMNKNEKIIFVINSCNHASLCRGSDGYIFFWNHVFGEENSTRTIYLFSREENLFSSLLMRGKVQMSCRKQEPAPAAWSCLNISDYPRNIQGKKFCIQLSSCSDSLQRRRGKWVLQALRFAGQFHDCYGTCI